jgi:hypothetical protein
MTCVTQPHRGSGVKLPVVAAAVALVALLVFAPLASATSDPLAGGTTTLNFNKNFFKKMKKSDVKILKISPTKIAGRIASLTVSGGSVDPTTGLGTINLSGGLKFKDGKKNVTLKSLIIDTTGKSLSGKVGNKSLKVASLAGVSFTRDGFGTDVNVGTMKLTGKAATQMNKSLGLKKSSEKVFKSNQVLGATASSTQPSTITVLPTGTANLVTDLGTDTKLAGLGVTIKPVAPTTPTAPLPPAFDFPIAGGTINPTASAGVLQTNGGLQLIQDLGGGKVTTMSLNGIWIDMAAKTATVEVVVDSTVDPKLNLGNLGRSSIADINLTGATITSDPAARTVSVKNGVATLQAVTAATLNSVFGTPLGKAPFVTGDGLGTFSFTAQTQ